MLYFLLMLLMNLGLQIELHNLLVMCVSVINFSITATLYRNVFRMRIWESVNKLVVGV